MRKLFVVCVLFVSLGAQPLAHAPVPAACPSIAIAKLTSRSPGGAPQYGTAIAVGLSPARRALFVTALHCTSWSGSITIEAGGASMPASIYAIDSYHDIALLVADVPAGARLSVWSIATVTPDGAYKWGGYQPYGSRKYIESSAWTTKWPEKRYRDTSLQGDVLVKQGMSGGPVYKMPGVLCGMILTVQDETSAAVNGSIINKAVRAANSSLRREALTPR